jgi:hypothetical protein
MKREKLLASENSISKLKWGLEVLAQVVECLLNKCEALSSNHSITKKKKTKNWTENNELEFEGNIEDRKNEWVDQSINVYWVPDVLLNVFIWIEIIFK